MNISQMFKTTQRFIKRSVLALAAAAVCGGLPAARAAIIIGDDTFTLSSGGGQDDASVVGQWTTAKGSAPVDTANDLLMNHATVSMSAPKLGLGDSLSYINDGLMLSGGKHSGQTEGLCLFTSDGAWTGSGPVDVVFTLDAAYNIGRIDGFTLWDLSRLGQKYDLYGSTDGGANWTLVTSVSKDATGSDGNRYIRRISLTDSSGVITGLAGVNALKFHIMDPGPNGATDNNSIYAEIAAYALVVANAANSTVAAAPTTVASDGITTSTITVTLRDASNNPVAGKTVTLASNRDEGLDTISAASGSSSSSGVVTFTVKSSTSGSAIFTATDVTDSLVISPSTATVTFEAGAVSAANSTVAADPSSVTANGSDTSTITVTLKDSGGTAVSGKTVTLASSRGSTDTISAASGVSSASGVVTFTVYSTTAGSPIFTATGDSVPITQTASVTFTAGAVNAGTSTVTASPTVATADGIATSTITVTLLDANSNPVAGKTVTLASSRTSTDTISAASGVSSASGVVTFTVKSSTAGSPVFTATGDSVPITDTATVSFAYVLPVTDTTVNTLASDESDSEVVAKWTTDQGSAPVDTVNDLLKNHATASMSAGGLALGDSLSAINDGLLLSGGHTSSQTDGMCLFTSDGKWLGSGPVDLVFTLDASYDIARIDSFTLWDSSRTGQKYDLYGSTDGGASWTFVASVNKDSGPGGSDRDIRRISLANAGAVIPGLAGVNALKFHIMDPGPNGATSNNSIYSEIAAYAVIPPKGTLIMIF